jgi:hypothetical protein
MNNETTSSAPPEPPTLNHVQAAAVKYLPIAPGGLSVIGSILILITIFRNNPDVFRNVSCEFCSRMRSHHERDESRERGSNSDRHTSRSLRQRRNRRPDVYLRIMVAMSLYDALYSIFSSLTGTSLHPKSMGVVGARGTVESCSMQGFFVQWGFGSFAYGAGLSLYYVMAIRYNVSDDILAKYLEPLIHGTIFVFFFGSAVVGVSLGLFNSNTAICWISEYPYGCNLVEGLPCLRAPNPRLAILLMVTLPSCISVLVILISLGLVAQAVWQQRARMREHRLRLANYERASVLYFGNRSNSSIEASTPITNTRPASTQLEAVIEADDSSPSLKSKDSATNITQKPPRRNGKLNSSSAITLERHADQVVIQCFLYCLTFLNSIGWVNVVYGLVITGQLSRVVSDLYWVSLRIVCVDWSSSASPHVSVLLCSVQVMVVTSIFWPLQGFCNFVIFIRPRYAGARTKHPERSRLWVFYKVIWNPGETAAHRPTNPVSASSGVGALRVSFQIAGLDGMESLDSSESLDHTGHRHLQETDDIPEANIIEEETEAEG